jgi:hypothetical protein
MSTRYKVSLDGNLVGHIRLGPGKKVLRDDGTVINGDKHTCNDEKNPNHDDELHLTHFGREHHKELKGHGKFQSGRGRFFHDEPPPDEKRKILGRDDWEALDVGGPPLTD